MIEADLKMKEDIADELCSRDKELLESFHGKFIYRNCKLEFFKKKREEWRDRESGLEKKKDMFKELIKEDDKAISSPSIDQSKHPLWTSSRFDSTMKGILGFNESEPVVVKPKSKKKMNEISFMETSIQGQEEINRVFKNSKYVADGEIKEAPLKEEPQDEFMKGIMDAISGTKKKKEKKSEKEGKKRKFEA